MFASGVHTLGSNRPEPGLQVDFFPGCAANFTRARRGQNRELKCARADPPCLRSSAMKLPTSAMGSAV